MLPWGVTTAGDTRDVGWEGVSASFALLPADTDEPGIL